MSSSSQSFPTPLYTNIVVRHYDHEAFYPFNGEISRPRPASALKTAALIQQQHVLTTLAFLFLPKLMTDTSSTYFSLNELFEAVALLPEGAKKMSRNADDADLMVPPQYKQVPNDQNGEPQLLWNLWMLLTRRAIGLLTGIMLHGGVPSIMQYVEVVIGQFALDPDFQAKYISVSHSPTTERLVDGLRDYWDFRVETISSNSVIKFLHREVVNVLFERRVRTLKDLRLTVMDLITGDISKGLLQMSKYCSTPSAKIRDEAAAILSSLGLMVDPNSRASQNTLPEPNTPEALRRLMPLYTSKLVIHITTQMLVAIGDKLLKSALGGVTSEPKGSPVKLPTAVLCLPASLVHMELLALYRIWQDGGLRITSSEFVYDFSDADKVVSQAHCLLLRKMDKGELGEPAIEYAAELQSVVEKIQEQFQL